MARYQAVASTGSVHRKCNNNDKIAPVAAIAAH